MSGRGEAAPRIARLIGMVESEIAASLRSVGQDADDLDAFASGVWSCLVEPGDAVAGLLLRELGPARALAAVGDDASEVHAILVDRGAADVGPRGVGAAAIAAAFERWRPRATLDRIRASYRGASTVGARLVVPGSASWPAGLDDLGLHAPVALWVRGDPSRLVAQPGLAVVGARASSGYGEQAAIELVDGAATRGLSIFSGGAYGIDGAAHRAALAAGALTVAVLAGGIDRFYPAGHTDLLHRITREGAVVAEVPCGTSPSRWRFLQRNRVLAAATAATLVVEAGVRSGALNTAGHASQLGRPLGAVPGQITSPSSAGCHRLLRGPDATLVASVSDLLELVTPQLDVPPDDPAGGAAVGDGVAGGAGGDRARPLELRVLDALSPRRGRSESEVARSAGISDREARATLAVLELAGRARERDRGWVAAV